MDPQSPQSSYERHAARRRPDDRRPPITRVNRACNACRRAKIRCIGADEPPCERCRASRVECVLEKPPPSSGVEDRLQSLEAQMCGMRDLLQDVVAAVRSSQTHIQSQIPFPLSSSHSHSLRDSPSHRSQGTELATSPTSTHVDRAVGRIRHSFDSAPLDTPGSLSTPRYERELDLGSPAPSGVRSYPAPKFWHPSGRASVSSIRGNVRRMEGVEEKEEQVEGEAEGSGEVGGRSGQPTAVLEIQAGEMANPLGGMRDMATRLGATAEGEAGAEEDGGRDELVALDGESERASKRRRNDATHEAALSSRTHTSVDLDALADPITLNLVSLDEAASLVSVFYAGSADFINAYDASRDTLDALRARSAFSLSALLMVGARVRDGPRPSAIQKALVGHTQRMAMRTLISPPSGGGGIGGGSGGVEDVKALILLAAFSEHGWLVAGHAVRLAVELGLNGAFGELVRRGMGGDRVGEGRGDEMRADEGEGQRDGESRVDIEADRPLVEAARVWYAVYRLEHQMSYGLGRPAIVREDATIHNARLLLDHPLSLDSDTRLVYAVELLALRAPLHVDLTAGAEDEPLSPATLARLRWANEQLDAWERYWDAVLERRYGEEGTGFVRESLSMQRQLAELFLNSQLLRGVRSAADIVSMDDEKRALAQRAMGNALTCVDIVLRGRNYTRGLPYGTHYTHVCAAYAASLLVRIGRFFPDHVTLSSVAEDVEAVAALLAETSAGRYARSLRLMLRTARRAGVLPTSTREGEASRPAVTQDAEGRSVAQATTSLAAELGHAHADTSNTNSNSTEAPANDWLAALDAQLGLTSTATALSNSNSDLVGGAGWPEYDAHALFLNPDLGPGAGPGDAVPFVGLEDFFVPPELDDLLSGFEW